MGYKTLFLICLVRCSTTSYLNQNEHQMVHDLAEFSAKMYLNECPACRTTLIITTENDMVADEFFKIICHDPYDMGIFTVYLENFTAVQEGEYPGQKPDMTIIFLNEDNYANTIDVIFGIELFPFWHIRGKFLLVAHGVPEAADEEWIRETFEAFWEKQVLRVLLCFWRAEIKLYAYNPFLGNFGHEVTNRSDLSEIFAHRIRNMHGYPIKTYHIDTILPDRIREIDTAGKKSYVGLDGMFLGTVIHVLNATLIIHPISVDFNENLIKNTDLNTSFSRFMNVFSEMYDYDMLMNAARAYIDNDLDKVTLYDTDDMLILVPRATRIPQYLVMFQIVSLNVWCASLGSLLAVSMTAVLIRKFLAKQLYVGTVFLDNYRILVNGSPPERSRTKQERMLFVLWVMHCLVFSTLFQSIFMSTLIAPRYHPEVDTFEDLYKTDIKVYCAPYRRIQILRGNNGSNMQFYERLLNVPRDLTVFGEDLEWIVPYRHKHGLILAKQQIYELGHRDRKAANSYHLMRENPMPTVFVYCIRKEKIYFAEIQDIILRIQDAGLNIYWRHFDYFIIKPKLDGNKTDQGHRDEEVHSLTIYHFQSGFIMLLFGYSTAFVMFCFEIILSKIYKRCNGAKVFDYIP